MTQLRLKTVFWIVLVAVAVYAFARLAIEVLVAVAWTTGGIG